MLRDAVNKEEFEQAGITLYGPDDWRRPLARALGISRATVWRYWRGKFPIPQQTQMAIQNLLDRHEKARQ